MKLTKNQRKLLKKEVRQTSLDELAKKLDVNKKELVVYLKKKWRRDKFEKIIESKTDSGRHLTFKTTIKNFSFKNWLKQNWFFLAILFVLSFSVYFNSLPNDFLSDDIATVVESENITQVSYFLSGDLPFFSFPAFLKFTTYNLFGLNPIPYRLINVIAHASSGAALFLLVGFFFNFPVNFFVALIFVSHPILNEAVVWISGQPYSTSTFLTFLAFIFYLLAREKKKSSYLNLSIFLYAIVFFGSEKMVTFPGILIFYEILEGQILKSKTWKRLLPFCLVGTVRGLILIGLVPTRIQSLKTDYYQTPGLENPLKQIPIALGTYLELIFWPQRLVFYHSEETIPNLKEFLLKIAIFFPYLIALFYTFFKERRLFFWLSFFFITLIPVITPFKISWIVAERYVYFGAVGIFIPVVYLIYKLSQKIKQTKIAWIIIILVTVAFSVRTFYRNKDFQNQDTLWLASAKYAPSSPQNHNNLGDLYARRQEWDKAIEAFQTAIRLKPNYADAYHNLGNTYRQAGDQEKAIQSYQKATQFNRNLWQSYQNLGALYYEQQQLKPATEALEKATQINSDNDQLHANLGTVYLKTGQIELAKQEFQKALDLNSNSQRAQQGMAAISEMGKEPSPIPD